jgi:hypothetical protein
MPACLLNITPFLDHIQLSSYEEGYTKIHLRVLIAYYIMVQSFAM